MANYWLFKSEPFKFSWEQLKAKGEAGEEWDGIRNYQARNNMRAMKLGDKGFFYHSNEGLEVVGIAEVCNEIHPDSTTDDPRWECFGLNIPANPRPPEPATNLVLSPAGPGRVLAEFRRLRLTDETLYLRNGAINRINGMINMSFSCDGTQYIDHRSFFAQLDKFG